MYSVRRWMSRIYGVAFVDYKSGVPGVAVGVGYRDGAPNNQSDVLCTRGAVRISGSRDQFVKFPGKNRDGKGFGGSSGV